MLLDWSLKLKPDDYLSIVDLNDEELLIYGGINGLFLKVNRFNPNTFNHTYDKSL